MTTRIGPDRSRAIGEQNSYIARMSAASIKGSYYTISFLYTLSASVIWGVNTLFLLGAGLNIQEVFIANAFFALGSAVFELPTGVFADTKGRRFSFLMSVVVLCFATSGYVAVSLLGGGLAWFSVLSIFLGLGFTFYTGAVEAWVVDELKLVDSAEDLDPIFATAAGVSGVAMFIGTIGGGVLGTLALVYPYYVRSALLFVLFFFRLAFMKERGFQPAARGKGGYLGALVGVTRNSVRFGWGRPVVRLIMIGTFIQSIFMMWGFYGWQPYLLDMLGMREAVWISGLIAAGVACSAVIGNAAVPLMRRVFQRRTTILTIGVAVMAIASVVMGVTDRFGVAVSALIVMMISMGATMPVKQAYLHRKTPSEQRATVISFDSLIGSVGSVIGQTGLGWVARHFSLALGYVIGGGILALSTPVYRLLARRRDPDDTIASTGRMRGN
ncbi:MAG: MFS transporter [Spirochaetia bacterium]